MRILIMHRVPFQYIAYDEAFDHQVHDVTYVGTKSAMETIPSSLRCRRIERPGTGSVSEEVLAAIDSHPPFDRVVCMSQYEFFAAGRVREVLNVPGFTTEDILRNENKVVMKRHVLAKGLLAPRFLTAPAAISGETAPWSGPTVLKPVDGTGADHVYVFETFKEAVHAAKYNTPNIPDYDPTRFELEEYVSGPVWHCDGLLLGGEPVIVRASRYHGTCLNYARGKPLGSIQMPERDDICEQAVCFAKAVGMKSAIFHLELIESDRGFVFLEIAGRSGGGPIAETFELTNGFNLVRAELLIQVDDSPLETNLFRDQLTPHPPEGKYPVAAWALIPGHTLGCKYASVVGAESWRSHSLVKRWVEIAPDGELPTETSYFEWELGVWSILQGPDSKTVDEFVGMMFEHVSLVPRVRLIDALVSTDTGQQAA